MDAKSLDRIIQEEVRKVLAERNRDEHLLYPPDPAESLDPHACRGPVCGLPSQSPPPAHGLPAPRPQAAPPPRPQRDYSKPSVLCLLTGGYEEWDFWLATFRGWTADGVQLDAVLSAGARDLIGRDELLGAGFHVIEDPRETREAVYSVTRYDLVFCPSMSRTHAAKLALGITDNATLNAAIAALAQKVPFVISDEGLSPGACIACGNAIPAIQEVVRNYRDQLGKMGAKLLPAAEAAKHIRRRLLNHTESGAPELISTLITEEDAAKLEGPVIKVVRGGLVTPLAMDVLNSRGIEVVIVPKE